MVALNHIRFGSSLEVKKAVEIILLFVNLKMIYINIVIGLFKQI